MQIRWDGAINRRQTGDGVFGLFLLGLCKTALRLLFSSDRTDARLPLSLSSASCVDCSRLAIDTLVNLWDVNVRVITFYVLPGIAVFTEDGVSIIIVVPTNAFDGRIILNLSTHLRWMAICESRIGSKGRS
jgi:hypothetical protein